MPYCNTKTKLLDDAQGTLASLIDVIARQKEAVKNDDRKSVADLDIQLERLFGEKERTLGALYQHTQEHGC